MQVSELIRLLQKLPGDYSVGVYTLSITGLDPKFKHIDPVIGVTNLNRRVALSFGAGTTKVTREEIASTFEVTP